MRQLSFQEQILLDIAKEESTYESEYDGRTYIYCSHCHANAEHGDTEHEEDCRMLQARQALGSIWTEYEHEQEQKLQARLKREAEEQRKRDEERRAQEYKRERVPCNLCGRRVSRMGMKEHQASKKCQDKQKSNELREQEKRTGIVCITDIWINYEGKRCLQCDTPMPDAHSNAKFCSNKGKGNCKDRFNNMRPERIERAREWSMQKQAQRRLTLEDVFPTTLAGMLAWKADQEGWDDHKNY